MKNKLSFFFIVCVFLSLISCELFTVGNTITIINDSNNSIKVYIYESKNEDDDDDLLLSSNIAIGSQAIASIPNTQRENYYLFIKITQSDDESVYIFEYEDNSSFTFNFFGFETSSEYSISGEGVTLVELD